MIPPLLEPTSPPILKPVPAMPTWPSAYPYLTVP